MPPVVIAGAIAGAGAIGSAVIGSNAAKSAAKSNQQAADAAAAETRAARDQAYSTLNPFVQGGTAAGGQINALLGLSNGTDWGAYVQNNPDALANWNAIQGTTDGAQFGGDIAKFGQYHYGADGSRRDLSGYSGTARAQQAFDQFRNSTGYQFRLDQGMNALNSGYAGAGTIKSGAAIKAAQDYGQGIASQEFGNYLNALGNQQGVGLQAGSAAAGVGVNSANSLGNIAIQNGANQANAALLKAQNTGQALNSLATIGANIFGQSSGGYNMPSAGQINTSALSSLRGY